MTGPLAIGADIVEVARVQRACERHGDRFIQRVFTSGEIGYCSELGNPFPSYAARFAAKEAVAKAFGTGIGAKFGWLDAEVRLLDSGAPVIELSPQAKALLAVLGGSRVLVTLSHTRELAQAVVMIV